MSMPDIRTAAVASANEENRAAAVTIRRTTDELKACSSRPRAVRRGEKVPPTDGTVGDPFGLLHRGPLCGERTGVGLDRTEPVTAGTGGLVGHLLSLLLEHLLKRPFGQSVRRGGGDLLHRLEVHVQSRPVVAEGPLGDDFAPLGRQDTQSVEFLGCEAWGRHDLSLSEVPTRATDAFPIPLPDPCKTPRKPRPGLSPGLSACPLPIRERDSYPDLSRNHRTSGS